MTSLSWAAYKLANAGGLKIAVFEKYPAQGGAVSNCPMSFCSTPDTPEAQKSAYEVFARFSNYSANMGLISKMLKYSSEIPKIICEECKIEAPMIVRRNPAEYGTQRGYTVGHANGLDVGDIYFLKGRVLDSRYFHDIFNFRKTAGLLPVPDDVLCPG